jgi:multimeric flavodoxin WrbA
MKVLGINASPRKDGNTQTLVQAVLEGAAEKGAETRLVNLREMEIKGCLGCDGCKKDLGHCVQKDDLPRLMKEMTMVDAIVMGTPVYWYHVSAQFKTLVDRLYCFVGFETGPNPGDIEYVRAFPAGKKVAVVTSRGDVEDTDYAPQFYNYMDEWLNFVLDGMGPSSKHFINQYGTNDDKKAAVNDAALIEKAKAVGASFVDK